MILNTENLSALFTAYSAAFKLAFDRAASQWDKVATLVPSATAQNLYAFLGQFPNLREWLGDRQIKNLASYNYTIVNKQYEATVAVPRPAILDDQWAVFSPIMEEMGYAAKMHPDFLVFSLLAAGASTLCYDGQFFFDTDHPSKTAAGVATTVDNYDATPGGTGNLWMLLDTSRPLKPVIFQKREEYAFQARVAPTDPNVFYQNEFHYGVNARVNVGFGLWQTAYGSLGELNATNFNAYIAKMMALRGDEGKPLNIMPNLLVCGPSNRAAARQLLETEILFQKVESTAGSYTMQPGGSNPNYHQVDLLVVPWLT